MQTTSQLSVVSVALNTVQLLVGVVGKIRSQDRDLANQLTRSMSSVAANLAEGDGSSGGTKRSRYETALGSARETRTHLQTAAAWGYVSGDEVAPIDRELDRVCAMTYRLLHPR